MPGESKQTTKALTLKTISEGGMWGIRIKDINRWVNEDGRVNIKFIIYHLSL